jgi:hypothetical protein
LKEIAAMAKSGNNIEHQELVDAIAQECKAQQMKQMAQIAETAVL